jgi:hypothetical protein
MAYVASNRVERLRLLLAVTRPVIEKVRGSVSVMATTSAREWL